MVAVTEHPSADQLADLAADELPADFGAMVEAHVFECQQCYDLLAEAESMGQVLRNAPDPVMPDDVWGRLAEAFAAAGGVAPSVPATPASPALADEEQWLTQSWPAVPDAGWTPQAPDPQPSPPTFFEDAPTSQWQVFVDEADDEVDDRPRRIRAAEAAAAETGPNAPADHVPRRREGSRLGRPSMSVSRLRSRRDVREERRHASLERYGRPLGIAAGVVLAVGLGGVAVKGLAGAGTADSSVSVAAGANPEAASGDAATTGLGVVSTGTNYTKTTITTAALKQAKAAMSLAAADGAGAPAGGSMPATARDANGSAAAGSSAAASVPATATQKLAGTPSPVPGPATRAASAGDGSDQRLRDPAALQACLKELGVTAGTTPILVDLAKFDGRDAAIIVLAGRDGGYEVWAVARGCRTGAGGQLSYTSVPAS